jgi:hypothetical protein
MTPEKIHATEQVLLVNSDLCDLYEKRGVPRDDLLEVFRLATKASAPPEDEALNALFDEIKVKAKAAWTESQRGRRDFPKMLHDGLNVVVESVFKETIKALYPQEAPDVKA